MTRLPTRRAAVIAGAGVLLVLAGASAQAGWLFVLAALVFGVVASSVFVDHRHNSIEIERDVPYRVRVGDDVATRLTVTNKSARAIPIGLLADRFPAFEPVTVAHEAVPPKGSATLELVRLAIRRGIFESGPVRWTSGAPFGLVRTRRDLDIASPLRVVPRWVELATFPILEPSSSPSDVVHERARAGAGDEYLGVREYRPGDSPRHIHWRSTARAQTLIVREYERETALPIALMLSGEDFGAAPDSAYEALVAAMVSVGMYALTTGHPVVAVRAAANGPKVLTLPGRADLLDWAAGAEPVDVPFDAVVGRALEWIGRRGTGVLFTPSAGVAAASARDAVTAVQSVGARAIVVVADANSWDANAELQVGFTSERAIVRRVARGEDLAACLAG